jgi:hypothetical protein
MRLTALWLDKAYPLYWQDGVLCALCGPISTVVPLQLHEEPGDSYKAMKAQVKHLKRQGYQNVKLVPVLSGMASNL